MCLPLHRRNLLLCQRPRGHPDMSSIVLARSKTSDGGIIDRHVGGKILRQVGSLQGLCSMVSSCKKKVGVGERNGRKDWNRPCTCVLALSPPALPVDCIVSFAFRSCLTYEHCVSTTRKIPLHWKVCMLLDLTYFRCPGSSQEENNQ